MRGLLLLSEQQYDDAEACFLEAVAIQDAIHLPLLYSDMRLLLVFCYVQANRSADALRVLEPALDEHVAEGTPGRIRTEGPRVAVPLLRLAAANGLHPGFANDLLRSMGEMPIDGEPGGVRVPQTGEILTERELDVLRLIAAGASNGAIAERLVISVHTVKSHVAHVLAKLHASSRAEAGARARDWRLI
jgi:LuxR family maltose regulon positive regulatory protein